MEKFISNPNIKILTNFISELDFIKEGLWKQFNPEFKTGNKYLIEGLMVAIAAFAIPKRSLNLEEIALIALTAAATFAILDTYIPSMGVTARSGAGFGIGANLVNFPGGF